MVPEGDEVAGKARFSAHGQVLGLQSVGVHVQEHVRERQTQFNGVGPSVQHAGVAVPALVGMFDLGRLACGSVEAEHLEGAHVGAYAAANAFFLVDYRGHIPSPSQKWNSRGGRCSSLTRTGFHKRGRETIAHATV